MRKSWTYIDFLLVILGGFVGAGVFVAVATLLNNDELALVMVLIGQYVGHLVALWLIARTKKEPDLGFVIEGRDFLYLFLGVGLQLGLAILFLPLSTLLFPNGDTAQQVGSALGGLQTTSARVAAVFTATVVAPATEELIFRGVLIKAMGKHSRRVIMVASAGVFAAFHLLGLDPTRLLAASAVVLPQLFLVGLLLAWVTLRSGRLGPAIFIHSGFNLLAALILLLPTRLLDGLG
ncbi:MAG: type II CAAX endopeptidase family protein [Acidimicrobiia bacterium]